MSTRSSPWPAGVPCWADLTTAEVGAASAFYCAVLGWTSSRLEREEGGYVVAEVGGAAAAGLNPSTDSGLGGWRIYLASDDVDASAAAATALGGAVIEAPNDLGPLGRAALITDPLGACFGLWQAGEVIGSRHVNEPGGLCWEELRSTDTIVSSSFYHDLFGYAFHPEPAYPPGYLSFELPHEGVGLGGVRRAVQIEAVPTGWLPFFGVHDARTAGEIAVGLGGSVVLADYDTAHGTVACLADPEGAPFWVVTSSGAAQPDRTG